MRKSFRALGGSHKWLLIAAVEGGHGPELSEVHALFRSHSSVGAHGDPSELVDELRESFIQVQEDFSGQTYVAWMHPSYRDLVIEELSTDPELRNRFLNTCSVEGLKLAISNEGGTTGERELPLMADEESWRRLRDRASMVAGSSSAEAIGELLTALTAAHRSSKHRATRDELTAVIEAVCSAACSRWNASSTALTSEQLASYISASSAVVPLPPVPNLEESWDRTTQILKTEMAKTRLLSGDALVEWIEVIRLIRISEPRFLRQKGFPWNFAEEVNQLLERVENESSFDEDTDDPGEASADSHRLAALARVMSELSNLPGQHREKASQLHDELMGASSDAEARSSELYADEEPDYEDEDRTVSGSFNITALFSDL